MDRTESLMYEAGSLVKRLVEEQMSRNVPEGWIDYRNARLTHAANRAEERATRRTMKVLFS